MEAGQTEVSDTAKRINRILKPQVSMEGLKMPEVVHYFIIKVMDKKPGNIVELLRWDNMRFKLRIKYDWYFKYRAALLQVKYPKYIVESTWGSEPAKGKPLEQIRKEKISAQKAKITKISNRLKKAKLEWNSLFPIEDDIFYKQAIVKLEKLQAELDSMENA